MLKKILCALTLHNEKHVTFTERREDGYLQEYAIHTCSCGKSSWEMPVGDNIRF